MTNRFRRSTQEEIEMTHRHDSDKLRLKSLNEARLALAASNARLRAHLLNQKVDLGVAPVIAKKP